MKPVAPVMNAFIRKTKGQGKETEEIISPSPCLPFSPSSSDSHHLKVNFPVVRAVEFGKENALPSSDFQPAVDNRYGNAMADHERAKMRVGVSAIAIGKQRVIMFVVDGARNELFEQIGHVG